MCGIQQKRAPLNRSIGVHAHAPTFELKGCTLTFRALRGLKGEYFKSRVSGLVHLVTVVTRALPCSIHSISPRHRALPLPSAAPARRGL